MRADKKLNGYLTVEAAFLVPAAVFLLMFVAHLAFLMSGRTYLAQDAYILAFRASLLQEEDDAAAFVSSVLSRQVSHKYAGNDAPNAETGTEGKQVVVKLKTRTHRRAFDLADYTPWEQESAAAAYRVDVTKRIRRIDRIADIACMALKELQSNEGR